MAQRRRAPPAATSRSRKRTPSGPSLFTHVWAALRWIGRAARPRRASELLALIFVCLATVTAGVATIGGISTGRSPGPRMFWVTSILALAFVARLSPWWREELREMTGPRARSYLGSALTVFVALSLCWRVVSTYVGLGDVYLLLGPFSQAPAAIVVLAIVAIAAAGLILDVPVGQWISRVWGSAAKTAQHTRKRRVLEMTHVDDLPMEVEDEPVALSTNEAHRSDKAQTSSSQRVALSPRSAGPVADRAPILPPIDIFNPPAKGPVAAPDLELKAQRIQETLESFGVKARVVGHHHGPVITQFDIQPERGVKVKSITALQNDLALALAAPTIRIQAPVPGKSVVGIEIPNSATTMVTVRELLESEQYNAIRSPLGVVLGKDVSGASAVIDLAKMPHLLISGATGSGKSVCVNTIISCLLYKNTPEQVRLLMVDPKMVELTVYNGVPHLLSPVVTQMDRVVGVLQWALREMERRYQLFADNTVRNIGRFNEKMEQHGKQPLPYLVLIIDELADLMMVAPEDVEDAICRLAQLARAAGIHLVIATQRPSVDVVTGLIKANFPARIAFAMTSQVDSRTILDTAGAEKLLGRGDMLYMPPDAPKPVRLQGAYMSDQEIERLVEFWKRSPLLAAMQRITADEFAQARKATDNSEDDLLLAAVTIVQEFQHASVSLLQRKLRIGYARAARVMDQLEARGIVGPADGSKQRPVLKSGGDQENSKSCH